MQFFFASHTKILLCALILYTYKIIYIICSWVEKNRECLIIFAAFVYIQLVLYTEMCNRMETFNSIEAKQMQWFQFNALFDRWMLIELLWILLLSDLKRKGISLPMQDRLNQMIQVHNYSLLVTWLDHFCLILNKERRFITWIFGMRSGFIS